MCPPAQIQPEAFFGKKEIRCLLVHDHVLLRQGLRRLLEDEPDIRKLVNYNLVQERFKVLEAEDGEQGLKIVQREKPDLVILDLMLPGQSLLASSSRMLAGLEAVLDQERPDCVLVQGDTATTFCGGPSRRTASNHLFSMARPGPEKLRWRKSSRCKPKANSSG